MRKREYWVLGYDQLQDQFYWLGPYTEKEAQKKASELIRRIKQTQFFLGKWQDKIYIVYPDGTRKRFFGLFKKRRVLAERG